jgi:hypothetical protein
MILSQKTARQGPFAGKKKGEEKKKEQKGERMANGGARV